MIIKATVNLLHPPLFPVRKQLEDSPLPVGQVMAYPQRRTIAAGTKPPNHGTRLFLKLRFRLDLCFAAVHHFLCATAPLLDQLPPKENPGDGGACREVLGILFPGASEFGCSEEEAFAGTKAPGML